MRRFNTVLLVGGMGFHALLSASVMAANVVVVDSKAFPRNHAACTVGVWVGNDVSLTGIVIPLEFRDTDANGSYIRGTQASDFQFNIPTTNRIGASPLGGSVTERILGEPATQACSGPISHTYKSNAPLDWVSPDGIMWAGLSSNGPPDLYFLPPGDDHVAGEFIDWPSQGQSTPYSAGPSLGFVFDVNAVPGTFEIDTCCTTPANHLSGTDLSVNLVSFSFTCGVITISNQSPVAVCRDITVSAGADCTAEASIDDGSYDPEGDAFTTTQMPAGPYPPGATICTLIVTDSFGAADTCMGTVTVNDVDPPSVSCPADTFVVAPRWESGAIVDLSATVSDNCPGSVVVVSPPSGSFFPAGITPVTCIAEDAAGNRDTCGFSVNVCACPCHGDPECDGVTTLQDVVLTTEVAFRGGTPLFDPTCPKEQTDVNCDGYTDLRDVVRVVNVAFRGGNPATEFCVPCGM